MNLNNFQKEVNKKADLQKLELGHIALSDIKTLDSLLKSSEKMRSNFMKAYDKYITLDVDYDDLVDRENDADDKIEEEKEKLNTIERENNKREEKQYGEIEKAKKLSITASEKSDAMFKKVEAQKSVVKSHKIEINTQIQKFDNAIKSFNTAAKALGVTVDVAKYESMINRLDSVNMKKIN